LSLVVKGEIVVKKKKKEPSGLRPYRNTGIKIKRNQPCPCGSGKKAKRCCLEQVKAIAALPESVSRAFLEASNRQQMPIGSIEEPAQIEQLCQGQSQEAIDERQAALEK